ncbi:MAG: dethiobiotin synthase [Pedobacter sp.]|nr:MAG: dethiobiotin synthase [Pedobacter sp.]
MSNIYFITGIGTGVGKTVISAIITEKLQADYWKPIQSGDLDISDSLFVKNLISNKKSVVHHEKYRLSQPLSPHLSARLDGIEIDLTSIVPPQVSGDLVIEGAGGLMVPLNDEELILHLIKRLSPKVIVVSQNYLGSINHTLLTLEALKAHHIEVAGLIFNGAANPESENYIESYAGVKVIGRIPAMNVIDKETVKKAGQYISL